MIPSLSPTANLFLNRLTKIQETITTATAQLTSGYRINQPSDAPDEISPLLQLQASLSHNQAVASSLTRVQADVSTADQAVSNGIQILDQALTIAAQGVNSTTSVSTRAVLAQQVESIQEQMVSIADTQVAGRYVFSGDQDMSPPYALQLTGPVQVGQAAKAAPIKSGDTAVFHIQTTSGVNDLTITGQPGDTLQGQIANLNAQVQSLGISASLDNNGYLQFASANAFSVSAQATGHANLVALGPGFETANNTGLSDFQFTPQIPPPGGGSHVQITVGGVTATAALINPAAPDSTDINAINDALAAQGITSVSAVLDQTVPGTISFQGTGNFSIADDSAVSGTYVPDGNSTAAPFPLNGVDRLLTTPVTASRQIELSDNSFVKPDQTAQDLFDHRNADDSMAPDNVFAALNALRVALENPNDLSPDQVQAAISTAQTSLQSASAYLNTKETFYGNTQNLITNATNQINTENVNLQQQISNLRDTDAVSTALELTSAETQDQAALAAEAKIPNTSLFDFLG